MNFNEKELKCPSGGSQSPQDSSIFIACLHNISFVNCFYKTGHNSPDIAVCTTQMIYLPNITILYHVLVTKSQMLFLQVRIKQRGPLLCFNLL